MRRDGREKPIGGDQGPVAASFPPGRKARDCPPGSAGAFRPNQATPAVGDSVPAGARCRPSPRERRVTSLCRQGNSSPAGAASTAATLAGGRSDAPLRGLPEIGAPAIAGTPEQRDRDDAAGCIASRSRRRRAASEAHRRGHGSAGARWAVRSASNVGGESVARGNQNRTAARGPSTGPKRLGAPRVAPSAALA